MTLFAVLPLHGHAFSAPQVSTHNSCGYTASCCASQSSSMSADPPGATNNRDTPVAPTTPAGGLHLLNSSNGTSQNRGSGSGTQYDDASGSENQARYVRTDYDNYIHEDLSRHRVYISFENGLHNLLHVPEDAEAYEGIIEHITDDTKYQELRAAYLNLCDNPNSIESQLYEPQAELCNHVISLVNEFISPPKRKDKLLHFQTSNKKHVSQGIFGKSSPDIVGKFKSLGDREPLVWPMIVHVEEMKDSDVVLDEGHDSPHAMKPGESDPASKHCNSKRPRNSGTMSEAPEAAPSNGERPGNSDKTTTSNKRKRGAESAGSNRDDVPSNSQTPNSTPSQSNANSTTRTKDSSAIRDTRLQCAQYLMEMLELSVLRSHAFLTLVDRDHLQLMYADRSAIITTSIIDLRDSTGETNFLKMLIAFHHLTPEQWGFLPLVQHSFTRTPSGETAYHRQEGSATNKVECLRGLEFRLDQRPREGPPIYLTLEDIIYHQPGIIGRGTCVVGARCQKPEEWKGQELVVKVSWPSKSRKSETHLLGLAHKKAEELIKARRAQQAVLRSESKKFRVAGNIDEADEKLKLAECLVEESGKHWVLNHLPNVLHSEDIQLGTEANPLPQTKLAAFFAKAEYTNNTSKFCYEVRALRISIQERLHKLLKLLSVLGCAQALYDVFLCHKWLYDYARILHRDISLANIMYRLIDNKVYGVLNDFDLSSLREDVERGDATSLQRTGTPPYMAIDLLCSDCQHLYRHDLESLFYVGLLLCSRNKLVPDHGIQPSNKRQFKDWFDATSAWSDLAGRKTIFFLQTTSLYPYLDPSFRDLRPWLDILFSAFKAGLVAKATWTAKLASYQHKLYQAAHPLNDMQRAHLARLQQYGVAAFEYITPESEVLPPSPFDEDTLNGKVEFGVLSRKLFLFGNTKIEYRSKDILPVPID